MTWRQHQREGFFGFTPSTEKGIAPQKRHRARVDINQAVAESEVLVGFWKETMRHPTAPRLSGGVLDWPAYLVDAFAIADEEVAAITLFLKQERRG